MAFLLRSSDFTNAKNWLETWELFINLVKAFYVAPREALFTILRHFGSPGHFVNIVILIHDRALTNLKIGEDDSE